MRPRPRRLSGAPVALLGLAAALAGLCGCRATVANQPIFASGGGGGFSQSFEAAIDALEAKGYAIQQADREGGRIVTERRYKQTWWWAIHVEVQQTGDTYFYVIGSEQVMRGGRITRGVYGYGQKVKILFERALAEME